MEEPRQKELDKYREKWKRTTLTLSKRPESDFKDGIRISNQDLKANIKKRITDLSNILFELHKIYHVNRNQYGDAFLAFVGDKVIRHWPWKDYPLISEKALVELGCKSNQIIGFEKIELKMLSKNLHYEHLTPISFFRDFFHDNTNLTVEDFEYVLSKYYRVVWITKEENEKLNKKGFKTTRPKDAYEQCEIEIIDLY